MKLANLIFESSLTRLHSKMQDGIVGIITAYRADFTKKENQQRNKSLLAKLMAKRYSVTAVKGSYIENYESDDEREVSEHSFFVAPTNPEHLKTIENDLVALGQGFDQDSVLIITNGNGELVGTSNRENAWPTFGKRESVGRFKGGHAAEFMSRINNRPFIFGESYEYPATINGIRGLTILANKDWKDIELD